MNLQQKREAIYRLKNQLEELVIERDGFELDESDYEQEYCDMLDELYGEIKIGNLGYWTSYVLKEVDPIAFGCGLSEYVDSKELEDSDEYNELCTKIEDLESEIEDLESEIECFNPEIE